MEAMQNSREVREATDRSITLSRRFFKNKKASSLKEVKEDREKKYEWKHCKELQWFGSQEVLEAPSLEFFWKVTGAD